MMHKNILFWLELPNSPIIRALHISLFGILNIFFKANPQIKACLKIYMLIISHHISFHQVTVGFFSRISSKPTIQYKYFSVLNYHCTRAPQTSSLSFIYTCISHVICEQLVPIALTLQQGAIFNYYFLWL